MADLLSKDLQTNLLAQSRFLKTMLKNFSDQHKIDYFNYFYILDRVAKLTEEVGEVSSATLELLGLRNKQPKTLKQKKENLAEELSDVIIVAILLADAAGVDLNTALSKKLEKIKKRRPKIKEQLGIK